MSSSHHDHGRWFFVGAKLSSPICSTAGDFDDSFETICGEEVVVSSDNDVLLLSICVSSGSVKLGYDVRVKRVVGIGLFIGIYFSWSPSFLVWDLISLVSFLSGLFLSVSLPISLSYIPCDCYGSESLVCAYLSVSFSLYTL